PTPRPSPTLALHNPIATAVSSLSLHDALPISNFGFARALMEHLGESGTFLIWSLHENTVLNTISRHMHRYRCSDPQLEKWLDTIDRKSTRLNSSHGSISYAVFCLKIKTTTDDW